MTEIGIFKTSGHSFRACRRLTAFKCQIDGMTLAGMAMDWEVRRADNSNFPLPDHLFRLLFEPIDNQARELLNQKYTVTASMTESSTVKDLAGILKNKFKRISS